MYLYWRTYFLVCLLNFSLGSPLFAQLEGSNSPSKTFPKQKEPEKMNLLIPDPKTDFLKAPITSRLELKEPMLDMNTKKKYKD